MKKTLLLLIPAFMLLSACTANSSDEPQPDVPTPTPIERQIEDITISVTVSGIDSFEGSHAVIFMNADALGTSSSWGTAKMTQDATNPNLWSTVIEDFELEQSISYNFYYGSDGEQPTPDWINGKNLIEDSEYYTLVTELNKTSYSLNAEFNVPEVSGYVDIEFIIEPMVMETYTSEPTALVLNEGIYVWAYDSVSGGESKLVDNDNGTWSFVAEDVPLLEGVATVQITPTLGTATNPNWNYQIGKWKSASEFEKWDTGISYQFTSENTVYTYSGDSWYFPGQPEIVSNTINFQLIVTPVWQDSSALADTTDLYVAGDAALFNQDSENWAYAKMERQTNGTFTYDFTASQTGSLAYAIYTELSTKSFNWATKSNEGDQSVTVAQDMADVSVTATWASQPVVPTTTYTLTVTLVLSDEAAAVTTGTGFRAGTHAWVGTDLTWQGNCTGSGANWSYTYESGTAEFYIGFSAWGDVSYHIGKDTSWNAYKVTCIDTTCSLTITTASVTPTSGGVIASTASNAVNCTVA